MEIIVYDKEPSTMDEYVIAFQNGTARFSLKYLFIAKNKMNQQTHIKGNNLSQ